MLNEQETAPPTNEQTAHDREAKRVAAVADLDLFGDSVGDSVDLAYDDAVYMASLICGTPISLVSVLEETKQRFKARIGVELSETPKDESFCVHAIQQEGLFVVADTLLDDRFRTLPLVTGAPRLRFYAGVPLLTIQGDAVGTLCVCDTVPRELTEPQRISLEILSRQVAARLHDRQRLKELTQILAEKERIEKDLHNSHALFEAFMDNTPLLSYMKDPEGRFLYYNRTFMETFGITRDQWIGSDERDFFPHEDGQRLVEIDREIYLKNQLSILETSVPGRDGAQRIWKSYKFNFVDASGERFLAAICHEITAEKKALREVERYHQELRRANERLKELSLTDPLTGCWNRRAFDERLARETAASERHGGALAILMIDIDNFKRVNDSFGHEVGDQVLCHVAKVLREGARGTDFVCRYGGEEFAILLPRTNIEGATIIAERLRLGVNGRWNGHAVTVSIGIAGRPETGEDPHAIVRCADEALYRAKARGRNQVVMASEAA